MKHPPGTWMLKCSGVSDATLRLRTIPPEDQETNVHFSTL